jgi:ABC-type long-subunit fatty acid transport system fused permease/ATPase subunit
MIQYDSIFFLILTIIYPSILARGQDFGIYSQITVSLGGRQNGNDSTCTWYSI